MNNPNEVLAGRAAEVIAIYQRLHSDVLEDKLTLLTDFLTDLMHYCHREGLDWNGAEITATYHFRLELENRI